MAAGSGSIDTATKKRVNQLQTTYKMAHVAATRAATSRFWCDHCSQWLSVKAFKDHKRLYYDQQTDQWIKKMRDDFYGLSEHLSD